MSVARTAILIIWALALMGCISTLRLDKTTLLTVGVGLHATFLRQVDAEAEAVQDQDDSDPEGDDGE